MFPGMLFYKICHIHTIMPSRRAIHAVPKAIHFKVQILSSLRLILIHILSPLLLLKYVLSGQAAFHHPKTFIDSFIKAHPDLGILH